MRQMTESDVTEILGLYQSGMKMRHISELMRNKGVMVFDHTVSKVVKNVGQFSVNKMGAEADEVVKEIQQVHKVPPARIKSLLLSYTRTEILNGRIDEKGDLVPKDMVVYIPI